MAVVYDVETFPNCFTLCAASLDDDRCYTWEISDYRDDRVSLLQWFDALAEQKVWMIGFNNEGFDYPVIHHLFCNRQATAAELYEIAMSIIKGGDRFAHTIWPRDRFAPQVDLMKVHHFDNRAKSTSLKALQFAMRSESLEDMPIPVGTVLTPEQVPVLRAYNQHDTLETKQFAIISKPMLDFREGLIDQFGVEVMSWNDTKIGEKTLEQRLGEEVCYERDAITGRRHRRQTIRSSIRVADIIFPYVQFDTPELQRILDFMRRQVLTPSEIDPEDPRIITKGVFKDLTAQVGGLTFHFGTGGVHASVERRVYQAAPDRLIRDIDVEGLYPNIAIANRLAPAHLGEQFIAEYARIPAERKKHAKGTAPNAMLKLAANGAWGKSNSVYSVFYDPQYAMTVPINGQLLLCMLVEKLVTVPTLELIQVNTDGVTYTIHPDYEPLAAQWCRWWEAGTLLKLEDADYSRMWIRDVNNYIAETTSGKLKLKGTYEAPSATDYHNSITSMSPPGWHKDWSALVVTRAATDAMVRGIPVEVGIAMNADPFDFMLRAKADKGARLVLGGQEIGKICRYYISKSGQALTKVQPPPAGYQYGWPKKAPKVSDTDYHRRMRETGYKWCETVCTKNKSVYGDGEQSVAAGWKVKLCNRASDFDWRDLDFDYYIAEAQKLVVTA